MSETILKVEGMGCNQCKAAVENALKGIGGVESVQVDLEEKEVEVKGSAEREQLVKAVENVGYNVVG
ncbi:MAG: cation transporter [Clostridiales bacterium]|nr:cation transporter [Clostridiales bacterium]MCF8023218.1 cation transporter [Clostridiales bacterium]